MQVAEFFFGILHFTTKQGVDLGRILESWHQSHRLKEMAVPCRGAGELTADARRLHATRMLRLGVL